MPKGECNMVQSTLGDGCGTCNPSLYLELLNDEFDELLRNFREAMLLLDNVQYWEGCPDDYKHRIECLNEEVEVYA